MRKNFGLILGMTLLIIILYSSIVFAGVKTYKFMESEYSNPKYYIAQETEPPNGIDDLRNTNVYFPANSSTMGIIKTPGHYTSPSVSEINGRIFSIEGYYRVVDSNGFSSFYTPCWRLVDIDNDNVIWVQIYDSYPNKNSFRSANEISEVLQGVESLKTYQNKPLWFNRKSSYSYKMNGNLQHLEETELKGVSYNKGELIIAFQRRDGMTFEWKVSTVLKDEYGGVIPNEKLITKMFFTENPYEKYDWSDDVWEAIKQGKICIGWNKEQCIISLGEPKRINRNIGTWGAYEQWIYDGKYVYFENNILTSWQD